MKKIVYSTIGVVIICTGLFFTVSPGADKKENAMNINGDNGFVVMELFTSQGCSSCPPADAILGKYALKNDEHIIPLAFHVDYWNRLGWKDTFSNNAFSQRQREYAERFNSESVYTPQLIINGQKQVVGSDEDKIEAITDEFLKERPSFNIKITSLKTLENRIGVDYALNSIPPNSTIHAALVQLNAVTQIRAGENRGVRLNNYSIVRDFKTMQLDKATGNFSLQLPGGDDQTGYQVILFIQDNASGVIRTAVKKNCK